MSSLLGYMKHVAGPQGCINVTYIVLLIVRLSDASNILSQLVVLCGLDCSWY